MESYSFNYVRLNAIAIQVFRINSYIAESLYSYFRNTCKYGPTSLFALDTPSIYSKRALPAAIRCSLHNAALSLC